MPEVDVLFSYEIPLAMKYAGQTLTPEEISHRPPSARHLSEFAAGPPILVPRDAFDTMLAGLFQSIAIPLDKGVTVPIAAAKPEDLSDLSFEEDLYPDMETEDETEEEDGWEEGDDLWGNDDEDEEDEELDEEDEDEALRDAEPEPE